MNANPSPGATAALYQAMLHSSDADKRAYIDGFAFRGDERAAKIIAPLLKFDDADIVVKAADALTILKEPSVYSELKEAHANCLKGVVRPLN